MLLKTILCTATFIVINLITNNLQLSIIGLIISSIIVLITYDYINIKKYNIVDKKIRLKVIGKLFKAGFNTFAFLFLTLYIINASRYVIDIMLESKYQAIYGILIMPATVLVLVSQFIIQPFLNNIKMLIMENRIIELKKLVLKLVITILIFGTICIILAWLIGIPVLELVYGIELSDYRMDLIIIIVGSILYGIVSILSAVLVAMRETKIQLIAFLVVSVITLISSVYLVERYLIIGATLTYLISMILLSTIYSYIYFIKLEGKRKSEKSISNSTSV